MKIGWVELKGTNMASSGMKDSGIALASNIFTVVVGIGTQSCLAWVLGPADRGSLAICLIFVSLMGTFCSVGLDSALQYYVAARRMSVSECISVALTIICMGGVLAALLGYLLMRLGLEFFEKAARDSFLIALAYIPIFMLDSFLPRFYVGLRDFKWMGIYKILSSMFKLVLILVLVLLFPLGVNGGLYASMITGAVMAGLTLAHLRRAHGLGLRLPKAEHMFLTWQYGIRFYFGKLGNLVNFQVGTIILAFFLGREAIGYFTVAARLMGYVIMIPNAIGMALLPRVADHATVGAKMVAQSTRISGLVCAVIVFLILILAKPMVYVVFSPEFLPMIPLMWLMAPGMIVRGSSKPIISYLNGTNRPGLSSMSIVLGLAVNLGTLFILLPLMDIYGGALSMTLGYFTSSLFIYFSFHILSGISYARMLYVNAEDRKYLEEKFSNILSKIIIRIKRK